MDSVRAYQGSPVFHHIEEESEEEVTVTPVHSVSRLGKAKMSSRRSPLTQRLVNIVTFIMYFVIL